MADVYCPQCGEPCDIYEFHDRADQLDSTFDEVRASFAAEGCAAMGWPHADVPNRGRASAAAAMFDILGDDVDGIAAMLEDAERLGMGW